MFCELDLTDSELIVHPRNPYLVKRLAELGLTQRQITLITGLSTGTVSAVVRLNRRPNRSTVRLLTAALRCTPADIGLDERGLELYPESCPAPLHGQPRRSEADGEGEAQ